MKNLKNLTLFVLIGLAFVGCSQVDGGSSNGSAQSQATPTTNPAPTTTLPPTKKFCSEAMKYLVLTVESTKPVSMVAQSCDQMEKELSANGECEVEEPYRLGPFNYSWADYREKCEKATIAYQDLKSQQGSDGADCDREMPVGAYNSACGRCEEFIQRYVGFEDVVTRYAESFNEGIKSEMLKLTFSYCSMMKPGPLDPQTLVCDGWSGKLQRIKKYDRQIALDICKVLKVRHGR